MHGKTGVVGHVRQPNLGFHKGGVVPLKARQNAVHDEGVSIRDEVGRQLFVVRQPVVVIGDDHEAIPSVEVVLMPQDPRPDLLVELDRPFVGPRDDDQIVFAVLGMEIHQQVFQFLTINPVKSRTQFKMGKGGWVVFVGHGHPHSQIMGVAEDGAVQFLPNHVVQ